MNPGLFAGIGVGVVLVLLMVIIVAGIMTMWYKRRVRSHPQAQAYELRDVNNNKSIDLEPTYKKVYSSNNQPINAESVIYRLAENPSNVSLHNHTCFIK